MKQWYKADLAHIHDTGHADFALCAAPGILAILRDSGIGKGLVVDLGCGSGLWARRLLDEGYDVCGIDISEAMIRLARKRAPEARFRLASLFDTPLPPCNAVTALGESINYLFDSGGRARSLRRLFRRVYGALAPGGLFVFDAAGPGQVERESESRVFAEGDGWAVLVEKSEEPERMLLTRRIITFRRVGSRYRRDEETHVQRLYKPADVAGELRRAGFRARILRGYGDYPLMKARAAFVARKPA